MKLERLFAGDETLYGQSPDVIARVLGQKLNELDGKGFDITSIEEVPDYHNYGRDGGTKDILILTEPKTNTKRLLWQTRVVRGQDTTMHGWSTGEILETTQRAIDRLSAGGHRMRHMVMITDHHDRAMMMPEGFGGYDGAKDVILCFNPGVPRR